MHFEFSMVYVFQEVSILRTLVLCPSFLPSFMSGMSNVRPAGRMRPANGQNAARKMILCYVMHAARERIKYIKHVARELISYVMHAAAR